MASFFTQSELHSDEYRKLTDAGSMRALLTIAASIMGDLCDQIIEPPGTIYDRFPSYADFCDWTRDFKVSESLSDYWTFYWNAAAQIFEFYERLPSLSDWDLHEEIFLCDRESPEMPDQVEESMVRDRIIETCFALSRWISGIPNENFPPVFEVGHSACK
jgi:hypothetical protein